jgi:hypothetical protein
MRPIRNPPPRASNRTTIGGTAKARKKAMLMQAVKAITAPTERSIPPVMITIPIPTARMATSDDCLRILKIFRGVGKDKGRKITNSIERRIKTRATIASGLARRSMNRDVLLVCLIPGLLVFSISFSFYYNWSYLYIIIEKLWCQAYFSIFDRKFDKIRKYLAFTHKRQYNRS